MGFSLQCRARNEPGNVESLLNHLQLANLLPVQPDDLGQVLTPAQQEVDHDYAKLPRLSTNFRPLWHKTSAALRKKVCSVQYGIRAHAEKTACARVSRKCIEMLGSTFFN
jgi:hypothetical protein